MEVGGNEYKQRRHERWETGLNLYFSGQMGGVEQEVSVGRSPRQSQSQKQEAAVFFPFCNDSLVE